MATVNEYLQTAAAAKFLGVSPNTLLNHTSHSSNLGGSNLPDDANLPAPKGQFLNYADGASKLQVRLEGNTVWLTQKLIAELYGVSVKTVNEHLVNIYSDAELPPEATIRSFRIVQRECTSDVSRNVEQIIQRADLAPGSTVLDSWLGVGHLHPQQLSQDIVQLASTSIQ